MSRKGHRTGGRPQELSDPQRLTIWVSGEDLKTWKQTAQEMQLTMGSLLRAAMRDYMEDIVDPEPRRHFDDF